MVSGSIPQLGNWQLKQAVTMTEIQTPHWEAEVSLLGNIYRLKIGKNPIKFLRSLTCAGAGAFEALPSHVQIRSAVCQGIAGA